MKQSYCGFLVYYLELAFIFMYVVFMLIFKIFKFCTVNMLSHLAKKQKRDSFWSHIILHMTIKVVFLLKMNSINLNYINYFLYFAFVFTVQYSPILKCGCIIFIWFVVPYMLKLYSVGFEFGC